MSYQENSFYFLYPLFQQSYQDKSVWLVSWKLASFAGKFDIEGPHIAAWLAGFR